MPPVNSAEARRGDFALPLINHGIPDFLLDCFNAGMQWLDGRTARGFTHRRGKFEGEMAAERKEFDASAKGRQQSRVAQSEDQARQVVHNGQDFRTRPIEGFGMAFALSGEGGPELSGFGRQLFSLQSRRYSSSGMYPASVTARASS
jgi:hypothetical protein